MAKPPSQRPSGTPVPEGIIARVAGAVKYVIKGVGPESWFGPNQPLTPVAQDKAKGRQFQYPVGFNINIQPRSYEGVSFAQLRGLADSYDILRLVIETRKDQIEKLNFSIRKRATAGKPTPIKELYDDRCAAVQEFLRFPDKVHPWQTWLRMIIEDMLVVDAATIYPRKTRGGQLYSLDLIDGTTIAPRMDDTGRPPMPPDVAYQQVLQGLPAVDYALNELHYMPRNPRTFKMYGCSPVEQVIMTVNIALRRQISQLQYYTEGNIPEAFLGVPETWNPDQIADFQNWWDSNMEGNTAQRRHAKFVPGEVAKNYKPTREPVLKDETDEWLARVICYCFSLPPTAFVRQQNRATAQTAAQTALQEGLVPLLMWVKNAMDLILQSDFGYTDLEFIWDEEDEDSVEVATRDNIYLRAGVISVDEVREKLGLEPLGIPNLVYTASGAETFDTILNSPEPTVLGPDGLPVSGLPPKVGPDGKPITPPKQLAGPGGKKPAAKPMDAKGAPTNKKPASAEVSKVAAAPFVKVHQHDKLMPTIWFQRTSTKRLLKAYTKQVYDVLQATATSVADQLSSALVLVEKAIAEDELNRVIKEINLSGLSVLMEPTRTALNKIGAETGKLAMLQVGVETADSKAWALLDDDVHAYAEDRAAELVGMRLLKDGTIVPNPNAQWNIEEPTRDMLRSLVANALEEGPVPATLRRQIMESEAFSAGRAQTIARTELTRAAGQGKLAGYKASGLNLMKVWSTADDDEVSEDCAANEEQGPILLDEPFQSGDDCEPAHPNCRCATTVVEVGQNEEE